MKNRDFDISGVNALSENESETINGGWHFWAGIAVAGILYLASEFDDIKQGWNDAAGGLDYNYQPCGC